ncbi:MAG TPA: hypothetical protein VK982_01625, partial [Bacteroidales bacterium]|nr:hypothetical protein [Bacteroidales bacterium]
HKIISTKMRGLPRKEYYYIHLDILVQEFLRTIPLNFKGQGVENLKDNTLKNLRTIKETEYKETEYKENKKNTKRVSLDDFYSYFPEEWIESKSFQSILKDYFYHRKEIGKTITQRSAQRLANKLSKYKQRVAAEAVERSIENGWQGVFPDNNTQSKKPKSSIKAPAGKQYPKGIKHYQR